MNAHPYKKLERLKAWKIADQALDELVANGDLKELTARRYILGYLLEQLQNADVLLPEKRPSNGVAHRYHQFVAKVN